MKHHSILSLFIFLLGLGITTTSCEDMLTPDMDRYSEGFSGKDTLYFYLGIVRNVQDMVEQNMLLADIRSDLADTTQYTSDSVANIATYDRQDNGENGLLNRAAYYKVINQCNYYLATCDTAAQKNSVYYMRKEYAQVVAIRAWAYLQLVQTYGRVPFITSPVDNANTGWETNPEGGWVDADNLVDKLKGDLEKGAAYEVAYGYPDYSTYNNGYSKLDSKYVFFYNDVVLGDLYLLRGASRADYVNAAKHYYTFLSTQMIDNATGTGTTSASYIEMKRGGKSTYIGSGSSWQSYIGGGTSFTDPFTVIPSASNSSFGRVLNRISQIYGFDSQSSNTTSTSTSTDDDGKETSTSTTTGSITLTANVKSRQIGPSQAYLNLVSAQTYTSPEMNSNSELTDVEYYDGAGDARIWGTCPQMQTSTGDKARFITKETPTSGLMNNTYATSPAFKYYKTIYRMRQIYLRYAEAINRAGYPRLAFTVLRNGLDFDKLPTLGDSIRYDDEAQTKQTVYYVDSVDVTNAANYIGLDELRRMADDPEASLYLDFSNSAWVNTGIHEFGCGTSSNLDSLYSYDYVVAQRIADEAKRAGVTSSAIARKVAALRSHKALADDEEATEETPVTPADRSTYTEIDPESYQKEADPLEIDAVESLIIDECALEMAFEGTRMHDLIRVARHKNNDTSGLFGANNGTQWLAWKIARRSLNLAPYESVNEKDSRLYNLLLTTDNWYIKNPEY